jgi:hypothetical protein
LPGVHAAQNPFGFHVVKDLATAGPTIELVLVFGVLESHSIKHNPTKNLILPLA